MKSQSLAESYIDTVGYTANRCAVIGNFRSDYFLSCFMADFPHEKVVFPTKYRALCSLAKPKNFFRAMRLVKHGLYVAAASSYLMERIEKQGVKVVFAFYSSTSVCLSLIATELLNVKFISVYPAQTRRKFMPFIPSPVCYCCFGNEDKKNLVEMGQKAANVYVTGSVYRNMYVYCLPRHVTKVATICIISSVTERVGTDRQRSTLGNEIFIRDSVERLLESDLGKNFSVVIAGRPQSKAEGRKVEREFYSGLLNHSQVRYQPNPGTGFDSYLLAESSELVVAQRSTLAFECLRLETRVLFVNVDDRQSPISRDYPFLVSDTSFDCFATELNRLRKISKRDYANAVAKFREANIGWLQM